MGKVKKSIIIVTIVLIFIGINIIFSDDLGYTARSLGLYKVEIMYFKINYQFTHNKMKLVDIGDIYMAKDDYKNAKKFYSKVKDYKFERNTYNMSVSLSYIFTYLCMDDYDGFVSAYNSQVGKFDGNIFTELTINWIAGYENKIKFLSNKDKFIDFAVSLYEECKNNGAYTNYDMNAFGISRLMAIKTEQPN